MRVYALAFALCLIAWAYAETDPITAMLFAVAALAAVMCARADRKGVER